MSGMSTIGWKLSAFLVALGLCFTTLPIASAQEAAALLGHGFEQCGLRLGRRAINFVSKDQLREDLFFLLFGLFGFVLLFVLGIFI